MAVNHHAEKLRLCGVLILKRRICIYLNKLYISVLVTGGRIRVQKCLLA